MKQPLSPELLAKRRAERHLARASQTYRTFLKEVESQTQLDSNVAEKLTSSVLCLLEQRLSPGEGKDFEAQLPVQLRTLIHRCAEHENLPSRKFHRADMMKELSREFSASHEQVENWVKAVFRVLCHRLTPGEIDDVVGQLPRDLRGLWPQAVLSRVEAQFEEQRKKAGLTAQTSPEGVHSSS